MAIQPKSTIKPLFVDGATPNGTAFGDWIDSCAFLNTDSSSTLTSLRMPVSTIPASAPSGYKTLFFSSANSNNLYAINSSGVISAIAPTQYMNAIILASAGFTNQILLLLKKPIKIKSVRSYVSLVGGSETVDVAVIAVPVTGTNLFICANQTIPSPPPTQDAIFNLALTTVNIPADHVIECAIDNYSGSLMYGCITIEYEEVN